jgi:S1-C subfamily serine protease
MLGSGFLVDRRHVVTAAHVVDAVGTLSLKRAGRVLASGTLVGADSKHDIAVIRLDRRVSGHVFTFSDRAPKRGERVAAVGYAGGAPLTVAHGSVRGIATTVPSPGMARRTVIETDAAVRHGESGGPLVSTADSAVLGMIDLSSADGGEPSFAVSARHLKDPVSRWRSDPEAVPQRPCRVAPAIPGVPLP